jgi:hypothetical protein
MHARDAIPKGDDRADFIDSDFRFVILDLLPDQLRYFVCFDLGHMKSASSCLAPSCEQSALSSQHSVQQGYESAIKTRSG